MDIIIKKIIVMIILAIVIPLFSHASVNLLTPEPRREDFFDRNIQRLTDLEYYRKDTGELLSEEEIKTHLAENKKNDQAYQKARDSYITMNTYVGFSVSIICIIIAILLPQSIIVSGILLGSITNLLFIALRKVNTTPPLAILLFAVIMIILTLRIAQPMLKKKNKEP